MQSEFSQQEIYMIKLVIGKNLQQCFWHFLSSFFLGTPTDLDRKLNLRASDIFCVGKPLITVINQYTLHLLATQFGVAKTI